MFGTDPMTARGTWILAYFMFQFQYVRHVTCLADAIIPRDHYKGCYSIDKLLHQTRYKPSRECYVDCWNKNWEWGAEGVSVVGGIFCGCPDESFLRGGTTDCPVSCKYLRQKCQCVRKQDGDYDKLVLQRAFDYMRSMPHPFDMKGYNCSEIPLNYFYKHYPTSPEERQAECMRLCNEIPRKFGSYITMLKCGCPKNKDLDDDSMMPLTSDCEDNMICLELKTSTCVCGDEELHHLAYARGSFQNYRDYDQVRGGPLFKSDKFRCYFTKTKDESGKSMRTPVALATKILPEDCILTCEKSRYSLAAVYHGGSCKCFEEKDLKRNSLNDFHCDGPCFDPRRLGCGGKYGAAVYTTSKNVQLTPQELQYLFETQQAAAAALPISTMYQPEFVGCFGLDELVFSVTEYKPTDECWEKCGGKAKAKIAVAGGRWCGCTTEGRPLGPGTAGCYIVCVFIPQPKCECYEDEVDQYNVKTEDMAADFIAELPKPHQFKGYNCRSTPKSEYKHIYPKPDTARAQECFAQTCPGKKRRYGGYLVGLRCGCKADKDPSNDAMLPVTRLCVDRMICIETHRSVCLCGNDKVDPLSYSQTPRAIGPLLNSDTFQCIAMAQQSQEAKKLRSTVTSEVWDPTKFQTPSACVTKCSEREFGFAGLVYKVGCFCMNYPGLRKFPDDNCWYCTWECGGPYTTSVYATPNKNGITEDDMLELLQKDVEAAAARSEEKALYDLDKKNLDAVVFGMSEEELQSEGNKEVDYLDYVIIFSGIAVLVIIQSIVCICFFCKKGRPTIKHEKVPSTDGEFESIVRPNTPRNTVTRFGIF